MTTNREAQMGWSPYRSAVTGLLVAVGLFLAAAGMAVVGQYVVGFLLFLGAPITSILFQQASRCPKCSKSPLHVTIGGWVWMNRFWPERTCSDCGTDLTVAAQ
jgi:hypothetical protein